MVDNFIVEEKVDNSIVKVKVVDNTAKVADVDISVKDAVIYRIVMAMVYSKIVEKVLIYILVGVEIVNEVSVVNIDANSLITIVANYFLDSAIKENLILSKVVT